MLAPIILCSYVLPLSMFAVGGYGGIVAGSVAGHELYKHRYSHLNRANETFKNLMEAGSQVLQGKDIILKGDGYLDINAMTGGFIRKQTVTSITDVMYTRSGQIVGGGTGAMIGLTMGRSVQKLFFNYLKKEVNIILVPKEDGTRKLIVLN